MADDALLQFAAERGIRYRQTAGDGPIRPTAAPAALHDALGGPLPDGPSDPFAVVHHLADTLEDGGLMGMASGRFFGFVIGGAVPAALAADWLVTAWDQNSGLFAPTPGTAITEAIAGQWVLELLGLPAEASFAFVTGGQMANTTALAAARQHVLAGAGWDVERQGLIGAPPVRVIAGDEAHVTIGRALRLLGLGTACLETTPTDANGAMSPEALEAALARGPAGPAIVCCQAGNVNTGAIDPVGALADVCHRHGAWLHVDGAVGLWRAAEGPDAIPGLARADSWSTDAHKWLNVPYDCGITICRHPAAHRAAMTVSASYLVQAAPGTDRDPVDWNPEFSRRARGVPVYAALASLGRSGVVAIIDRCRAHARRFAAVLRAEPEVAILNDVVLNQVLVRFTVPGGSPADHDARTRTVIAAVQADGTCWLGGSVWRGQQVMRISVSSAATTEADVERSAAAILRVARATPRG